MPDHDPIETAIQRLQGFQAGDFAFRPAARQSTLKALRTALEWLEQNTRELTDLFPEEPADEL